MDLDQLVREVHRSLADHAASPQPLLAEALAHVLDRPGKGLRTRLTLLSGACAAPALLGRAGDRDRLLRAAASVELVHVASLVHDDVIDGGRTRHGQETVNARYGDRVAVLVGDHLLATAAALGAGLGADLGADVSRALARSLSLLVEGEAAELAAGPVTVEAHLRTVALKTTTLFELAADVGSRVADGSAEVRDRLHGFGHHLGTSFQLVDDLRDLWMCDDGKSLSADLHNDVRTLPVLLATAQPSTAGVRLRRLLAEPARAEAGAVRELVADAGGIRAAADRARAGLGRAEDELRRLPDVPARKGLAGLVAEVAGLLAEVPA